MEDNKNKTEKCNRCGTIGKISKTDGRPICQLCGWDKKYETTKCYRCGTIGEMYEIDGRPVCQRCGWDTEKHPESWDAIEETFRDPLVNTTAVSFPMALSGKRESIHAGIRRHKKGLPIPDDTETEEQILEELKRQEETRKKKIKIRDDGTVEIRI